MSYFISAETIRLQMAPRGLFKRPPEHPEFKKVSRIAAPNLCRVEAELGKCQ